MITSGAKSNDVIYTALPLYHSAAMMIGLHGCIVIGKFFISTTIRGHLLKRKENTEFGYFPLL